MTIKKRSKTDRVVMWLDTTIIETKQLKLKLTLLTNDLKVVLVYNFKRKLGDGQCGIIGWYCNKTYLENIN